MIKKSLFLLLILPSMFYTQTKAKVIGIKDGDTIEVLLEGNTPLVLRLADVDCPEKKQAFGSNAKTFTSSQVFGKNIIFYPTSKDRYGRTIAEVYYGKKYLSEEIIKAGYGWWYHQYSKKTPLKSVQAKAKKGKIGLWKDKNAISPWDFRALKKKKKAA